ncbi:hypothetical protein ACVGVM_05740 [Pseudonocardia bannensis]|uniref:Uncharacterized protein n=1 Tax=Pseudonocardia bannensis TaxID=630973 RepID=A0A848DL65_9PSEU|nr:hypothetical protein [Pseudonocardia bannensis]NMH93283.1 hypothetical protein [Pseudonocardia bannensis]
MTGQRDLQSDVREDLPPLWARGRLDAVALKDLRWLTYTVAREWVPELAAHEFSRAAGEIAEEAIDRGGGNWDLWQDPGRLVCHVSLGDAHPAAGPGHPPDASSEPAAGTTAWRAYGAAHRVGVSHARDMMAVRVLIDDP